MTCGSKNGVTPLQPFEIVDLIESILEHDSVITSLQLEQGIATE